MFSFILYLVDDDIQGSALSGSHLILYEALKIAVTL